MTSKTSKNAILIGPYFGDTNLTVCADYARLKTLLPPFMFSLKAFYFDKSIVHKAQLHISK